MNKTIILLISIAILACDSKKKTPINISPEKAYTAIINNLDSLHPGRGIDVFDEEVKDRPMAYGLILSAESNRYKFVKEPDILNRIRLCGEWLISNSDINNNGIHGYGLADASDAFSDQTVNPAHQEYTITTAIALNGLMDWYNIEPDSITKSTIYNTVLKVISPFLSNEFLSPIGLPMYSFNSNEKEFDCYNPASFLAGQLKRFTSLTTNDSIKNLVNNKSETIIRIIMENHLTDSDGNIYWNYGIQERINRPNDLLHVSYTMEGIRDYLTFSKDSTIPWNKIYNHLNLFYSNNKWHEYIDKNRHNNKYNPRLWSLSMLMYDLAREGEYDRIKNTLWPQIKEHHIGDGVFTLKVDDDKELLRHDAHLLLGLSYYLFNEKTFPNKTYKQ